MLLVLLVACSPASIDLPRPERERAPVEVVKGGDDTGVDSETAGDSAGLEETTGDTGEEVDTGDTGAPVDGCTAPGFTVFHDPVTLAVGETVVLGYEGCGAVYTGGCSSNLASWWPDNDGTLPVNFTFVGDVEGETTCTLGLVLDGATTLATFVLTVSSA